MADENVVVRLKISGASVLAADARKSGRALQGIGRDAEASGRKADRAATSYSHLARTAGTASRLAARGAFGIAASGGALAAGVSVLGARYVSLKEQSQIAFSTMLKDGGKAKSFIADLSGFAARTPFELPGLLKTSQQLLAFRFRAKDVRPLMTSVGNAASGLAAGQEGMEAMVRALGQIKARGKASSEEMMQLAEQGVPAWAYLADAIGTDVAGAMKRVESGAVDGETAIRAITRGMDKDFAGMMARQAKTAAGLWSTIKDGARETSGEMVEPFWPQIKLLETRVASVLASPRVKSSLHDFSAEVAKEFSVLGRDVEHIWTANIDLGRKLELSASRLKQTGALDGLKDGVTSALASAAAEGPTVMLKAMAQAPWPAKAILGGLLATKFAPLFRGLSSTAIRGLGAGGAKTGIGGKALSLFGGLGATPLRPLYVVVTKAPGGLATKRTAAAAGAGGASAKTVAKNLLGGLRQAAPRFARTGLRGGGVAGFGGAMLFPDQGGGGGIKPGESTRAYNRRIMRNLGANAGQNFASALAERRPAIRRAAGTVVVDAVAVFQGLPDDAKKFGRSSIVTMAREMEANKAVAQGSARSVVEAIEREWEAFRVRQIDLWTDSLRPEPPNPFLQPVGGPTTVQVQIDGRVIADAVIKDAKRRAANG